MSTPFSLAASTTLSNGSYQGWKDKIKWSYKVLPSSFEYFFAFTPTLFRKLRIRLLASACKQKPAILGKYRMGSNENKKGTYKRCLPSDK